MFDLTKESILAKTPINEYNAGQNTKYGRIKSVQFNQEKRALHRQCPEQNYTPSTV